MRNFMFIFFTNIIRVIKSRMKGGWDVWHAWER